ncbi:MAG: HEPN domain-containing protein [Methanobacterium sp. ERen5]|nr:MAG: HEPN domain-containing protein [Methanobacterium sp. ERen5]
MIHEINFMGLLANVDSSILILNEILPDGIEIRSFNRDDECLEFFNELTGSSYQDTQLRLYQNSCWSPNNETYYFYSSFSADINQIQDRTDIDKGLNKFRNNSLAEIEHVIKMLRLYKEGNVQMPFRYYYKDTSGIMLLTGEHTCESIEAKPFVLNKDEFKDFKKFINNGKFFINTSVNLAFSNFEASYEVNHFNIKFLTLMNAMEILFHPAEAGELSYRISRNFAVLMGTNIEESKKYYKDMKKFYSKRSDLVHRGYTKKRITIGDVNKLRKYVRDSIKVFLDLHETEIYEILTYHGFGEREAVFEEIKEKVKKDQQNQEE